MAFAPIFKAHVPDRSVPACILESKMWPPQYLTSSRRLHGTDCKRTGSVSLGSLPKRTRVFEIVKCTVQGEQEISIGLTSAHITRSPVWGGGT